MTVSTFYPDGDPETNTVDGYVERDQGGEDWSDMRTATAGDNVVDAGALLVVRIRTYTITNKWNTMARPFVLFDTSSIVDSDTIDSGGSTFEFVAKETLDQLSPAQSMALVGLSSPASDTGLVAGDYDQTGSTRQASDITIASVTADESTYNAMTLNSTGDGNVNKAGITRFAMRIASELDDVEPTWASNQRAHIEFGSAEETLTGDKRPKLVVTHSAGAAGPPVGSLQLLGVGI